MQPRLRFMDFASFAGSLSTRWPRTSAPAWQFARRGQGLMSQTLEGTSNRLSRPRPAEQNVSIRAIQCLGARSVWISPTPFLSGLATKNLNFAFPTTNPTTIYGVQPDRRLLGLLQQQPHVPFFQRLQACGQVGGPGHWLKAACEPKPWIIFEAIFSVGWKRGEQTA